MKSFSFHYKKEPHNYQTNGKYEKILCIWVLTVTFLGAFPALADAQQWGLTANGLYWATATPNIGVEYAFHSKMSIAGLVQYNPFTYAKNRKMKHLAGQLEYRYWLSDVFKGHYLGVHATGGIFNFGNLPLGILKTIVSRAIVWWRTHLRLPVDHQQPGQHWRRYRIRISLC